MNQNFSEEILGTELGEPILIKNLVVIQYGVRWKETLMKQSIEFLKLGGRFDTEMLKKFEKKKVHLITLAKFPDVILYLL